MRWVTYLAIALATAFVMGFSSADRAEARGCTKAHSMCKRVHVRRVRHVRHVRRVRRTHVRRWVFVRKDRTAERAKRRAAAAKAHAEFRALFKRVPRVKYVAPTRPSRAEERAAHRAHAIKAHAEFRALFKRVPRKKYVVRKRTHRWSLFRHRTRKARHVRVVRMRRARNHR